MGVHSDTQNPGSKRVVVTFKEESGAEMAMLLTDTTFLEQEISISSVKVCTQRVFLLSGLLCGLFSHHLL